MMSDGVFGVFLNGAAFVLRVKLFSMDTINVGTLNAPAGSGQAGLIGAGAGTGIQCTSSALVQAIPSISPVAAAGCLVVGGVAVTAIYIYRKEIRAMFKSAWQLFLDTAYGCHEWVMGMLKVIKEKLQQSLDSLLAWLQSRFETTTETGETTVTQDRKETHETIENKKSQEEKKEQMKSACDEYLQDSKKNLDILEEKVKKIDNHESTQHFFNKMRETTEAVKEFIKTL